MCSTIYVPLLVSLLRTSLRKLVSMCVCDNTFVFVTTDNTFVFDGKVYEQTDGVAMGSSLGPVLANIWMAHLEEQHIVTCSSSPLPAYYRRYVDDTFCLFQNLADAYTFLDYINSLDPSTIFDIEEEQNGQLPFLDTVVSRSSSRHYPDISTRVKPTDKGLFYNFASFLPERYKTSLVSCLGYRLLISHC